MVEYENLKIVNIYAPNRDLTSRQAELFLRLAGLTRPPDKLMLVGGAFNCVIRTSIDRHYANKDAFSTTESAELEYTLTSLRLVDSLADLHGTMMDNQEKDDYRARHFTFDSAAHGRRLDRFYVSAEHLGLLVEQYARQPVNHSDHKEYAIQWRLQRSARPRRRLKALYPPAPHSATQFKVAVQDPLCELVARYMAGDSGATAFNCFTVELQRLLRATHLLVSKQEKRAKRKQRLRQKELLESVDHEQVEVTRASALRKMQEQLAELLQQGGVGSKYFFKRISGRQAD